MYLGPSIPHDTAHFALLSRVKLPFAGFEFCGIWSGAGFDLSSKSEQENPLLALPYPAPPPLLTDPHTFLIGPHPFLLPLLTSEQEDNFLHNYKRVVLDQPLNLVPGAQEIQFVMVGALTTEVCCLLLHPSHHPDAPTSQTHPTPTTLVCTRSPLSHLPFSSGQSAPPSPSLPRALNRSWTSELSNSLQPGHSRPRLRLGPLRCSLALRTNGWSTRVTA